jgi:molybdenum cofactor synthesis domain-containing protein
MLDSRTDLDRMLPPSEARAIVLANVRPLEPEVVPLERAGDRYLAEPLVADVSLPPFPAATMDGFAVVHDDASVERAVLGSGFAGDDPTVQVTRGSAARIMTGAPVPAGADAVVPVENTTLRGNSVVIRQSSVRAGENIRPVGADLRAGDLLVRSGTLLGPAEVGLLASLGHAAVRVGRRPRVAVLSTGNELVAPGETPGPGQIRDSNRFSLALAARRAGAEVVVNRHVPDDEAQLRAGMHSALAQSDVLVTSGGVSMGHRDLVKALLGQLAEVHIRRLFMKPGKPFNFATAGEKLIFGLPGNPVSCLVGFHIFVRPALQVLQSAPPESHPTLPVIVTHDVPPSDRIEYQRAVVWADRDGRLHARNTGSQISARLMSFVGSNAFLVVPPRDEPYPAGSRLEAVMVDPPFAAEDGDRS